MTSPEATSQPQTWTFEYLAPDGRCWLPGNQTFAARRDVAIAIACRQRMWGERCPLMRIVNLEEPRLLGIVPRR